MPRPMTPEKFTAEHRLLVDAPDKYVDMISEFIREHPNDPSEYYSRHHGWVLLGRPDLALKDLDRSIFLEEKLVPLLTRGYLLGELGRYREALDDLDRAESLDPSLWVDCWGPLYRANCHARLGNEQAALADCAQLPDDFFSPGLSGTPSGNRAQIIAAIRRRAAEAKHGA